MKTIARFLKRHPLATTATALVVGLGAYLSWDILGVALTPDVPVGAALPTAPPLTPGTGDTVYRIDASDSQVELKVTEKLAGADTTAKLVTQGIAGDIALNAANPSSSRVGEIVVNVEQLTSDNSLRDKVIRREYLESHDHPLVRLSDVTLDGLPAKVPEGEEVRFTLDGSLAVKDVEHPVSFDATATLDGNTLRARASSTILMSDYGVGPITKVGLVGTGNEVAVTLDLTARDAASFTPPKNLSGDVEMAAVTADRGAPSFAQEIAPILAKNCASCHQSGKLGAHQWTLDTARDAAEVAAGLEVVTRSKYMPPWPASDKSVAFMHPRGLSDEEIDSIRRWAAAGGKLDVDGTTPVTPPAEPEVPQPRADLTLSSAEPYGGDPDQTDDYRCFILDPKFTAPSFITGYSFQPDRLDVVHHALVFRQDAATRAATDAKDTEDPGAGFACTAGMGGGTAGGGELVGGWVPGQRPMDFGDDVGFEFAPGDFLVAQIHYHYEDERPLDRSRFVIEVAKDPAKVTALDVRTLIGPVELPCPPDDNDGPLCDRAAAVADAADRFGPAGSFIPDVLHRLCGTTQEEVMAQSDGITAKTVCRFNVRRAGTIVDVLGHEHEIGSGYRMTLNPGTPEEKILLDIPVWNFDWQLNYQPVDPIPIKPGDVIGVECRWDRRLRYDPEPRYIVFAEGTEDEMCFSTVTIIPSPSDIPSDSGAGGGRRGGLGA